MDEDPYRAIELYDLETDPGEKFNVAAKYPEVVYMMEEILSEAHTKSEFFPMPGEK